MLKISVLHPSSTAFFAAEELKKYLKMMMPRKGEIPVSYDPSAKEGFRLGLMSELGLDLSDVRDPLMDDTVYLDTDEGGGLIAGSSEGALLIAVYRYLRFCGCRWLFPGVDGEWVPSLPSLPPVRYRKVADHRYRGQCNEGAEFQESMLETIDYTPKLGMNSYMMENDIPMSYYSRYYTHEHNPHRRDEKINYETVLKWKRECESEIERRGLRFHDMGHGWTVAPFGLDPNFDGIPEGAPADVHRHFALVGGERRAFSPIFNTNFCMSSEENRLTVARYVADYAETQNNVDFLHVWLSDGIKNHCECAACREKTPSDWYVLLLNDIDRQLTAKGLSTRLVFIAYTDTFWAPLSERLSNEERFTMLYAPIFRKYTETYAEEHRPEALRPFELNACEYPAGMGASLAYLDEWKKTWGGDCFCYEYHFWRHQLYDPSGITLARLLYDDITALEKNGLSGMIEDGSQRSFFPTGFPYYVYGETLFDKSRSFEELLEDYFSHAFGKNWQKAVDYLRSIGERLEFAFLSGERSLDGGVSPFYNPPLAAKMREVPALVAAFAPVIEENLEQAQRASHVSWELLIHFGKYVTLLSEAVALKAEGKDEEANAALLRLRDGMAENEVYIQRYYDHYLAVKWLGISIFRFKSRLMQ